MVVDKLTIIKKKHKITILGATLLSVDEVSSLLAEKDRAYRYCWALRTKGKKSNNASRVSSDGKNIRNYPIERSCFVMRPALILSDISDTGLKVGNCFNFGPYRFKVLSPTLAWLYEQDIGKTFFDWYDNNYDVSNIKDLVDSWFEELLKFESSFDVYVDKTTIHKEPQSISFTEATLLSMEEALIYLTSQERIYLDCWWLRTPGSTKNYVNLVLPDGRIIEDGCHSRKDFYVRPALVINNLYQSNFKIGDYFAVGEYRFKIISENLAWLYEQDIDFCFFDIGNNYYDYTHARYIVDEWFEILTKEG